MAANPDGMELYGDALPYSQVGQDSKSFTRQGAWIRIPIQDALRSDDETDPLANMRFRFNSTQDRFERASAILLHLEQHSIQVPDKRTIDAYLNVIVGGWQRGDRITPEGAQSTMSRPMPEDGLEISDGSYLDKYIADGGKLLVCGHTIEIRASHLSIVDLRAALEVNRAIEDNLINLNATPEKVEPKPPAVKAEKAIRRSVQARWLGGLLSPADVSDFERMDAEKKEVFAQSLAEKYKSLSVRGLNRAMQERRAQQMFVFLTGSSYAEVARITDNNYTNVFEGMRNARRTIRREFGNLRTEDILRRPEPTQPTE